MVYVGVDLHRKRSHIVALDAGGAPMLNRRTEAGEFLRTFGELGPDPLEVAFEATYGVGLVRGPPGRCWQRCSHVAPARH